MSDEQVSSALCSWSQILADADVQCSDELRDHLIVAHDVAVLAARTLQDRAGVLLSLIHI